MAWTRFLIISILLMLYRGNSQAHSYSRVTSNIGRVYYGAPVAGESRFKNQAIAYLCNEHLKRYFSKNKERIFLEFSVDSNDYFIGYDKIQGAKWGYYEKHNRPVKGYGIRIRISNENKRAEKVLKLLEYALHNLEKLKKESSIYYRMEEDDRPDELTVDSITLKSVIQSPTSKEILNTLNMPVRRNLGNLTPDIYTEYYFQNDKYYFIDFFNRDSVYLILDNVNQIITEYYLGVLIFETDSSGYFYSRKSKQSAKFLIKNKLPSFYYTHTSSDSSKNRIYFEYTPYVNDEKRKFIYVTDKFFLVDEVERFEDEMINKRIENYKN